jgi:asparagine synthetase B (glutamine-hydrolysing)
LRGVLVETLERDLDPGGRNLLTLSGGVDSTSLGALAAGTLGFGLSSFSLLPSWEPELSQELSYIDPLTREYGIEPARKLGLTQEVRKRWLRSSPGLPFQILHPALCELPGICEQQEVRVMVGGEFADEVCGEMGRIYDWARATSAWRLPLVSRRLPFGPRDYLRWARCRVRDALGRPWIRPPEELEAWVHPEIEAEYRAWRRRRVEAARGHGVVGSLRERSTLDGWVAMNWEGTTPLGVRRTIPFFTREVLELAFECDPSELLGPGKKKLLRAALRGDAPDRNLDRPDKGGWGSGMADQRLCLDGELPEFLEPLVRPDWFPRPPAEVPWEEGRGLVRARRGGEYLARSRQHPAPGR